MSNDLTEISRVFMATLIQIFDECEDPVLFGDTVRKLLTGFGCMCNDNHTAIEFLKSLMLTSYDLLLVIEDMSVIDNAKIQSAAEKVYNAFSTIDSIVVEGEENI